jgi:hypothetical protein
MHHGNANSYDPVLFGAKTMAVMGREGSRETSFVFVFVIIH